MYQFMPFAFLLGVGVSVAAYWVNHALYCRKVRRQRREAAEESAAASPRVVNGEVPPEIRGRLMDPGDLPNKHVSLTFSEGLCIDCGKKVPGEWSFPDRMNVPEGWRSLVVCDIMIAIQCPECHKEEESMAVKRG